MLLFQLTLLYINKYLYTLQFSYQNTVSRRCLYYTFSHCEPAPSQLNAAWGNSFRQLHSSFDNLLELRQIS